MSSRKRAIVKLDDEVFEVKSHPKKTGVTVAKMTDEEIFDATVLEGAFGKMLKNDFNALTNEVYHEVRQEIKNNIRSTVYNLLGFEQDYGGRGLRVDHCNGRMSTVSNYISEKVQDFIRDGAEELIKQQGPKILEESRAAILKDFRETFIHEIRYSARGAAAEAAKTLLKKIMASETERLEQQAARYLTAKVLSSEDAVQTPPSSKEEKDDTL